MDPHSLAFTNVAATPIVKEQISGYRLRQMLNLGGHAEFIEINSKSKYPICWNDCVIVLGMRA